MNLLHARGTLSADTCVVMGIVNRTPDSFYDGGRMDLGSCVEHALTLVEEGAAILDLGAVKAGPGDPVSEEDEMDRLLPLVEKVAAVTAVPLSVETHRPGVAKACIEAGAAIVNDVTGLSEPALAETCAGLGAAVVLMHHGGQLRGRPRHPGYDDVVGEVIASLAALAERAVGAGIPRESVIVDPGLDFGKNTFHSLSLMRGLGGLVVAGYPVLVAASRKDIVGETLGLGLGERLEGSLALAVLAAWSGAAIVRVHDVGATVRAVRMTEAVAGRVAPVAPLRGLWD